MSMPRDLVLVRHGESEGNVASKRERAGDLSLFTEEYATTPGHRWALTATGVAQAKAMGAWINTAFDLQASGHFDRYYTSPYRRAWQTAGHLGLHRYTRSIDGVLSGRSEPQWVFNRNFRERSWGYIGSISTAEFKSRPEYELAVRTRANDPLYFTPPGGESIADVAENRVRHDMDSLSAGAAHGRVLAVTHGETKMAWRLAVERLSDEEFEAIMRDKANRIPNLGVLHYSCSGPGGTRASDDLSWMRQAAPVLTGTDSTDPAHWTVEVGPWRPIEFKTYDNTALLSL